MAGSPIRRFIGPTLPRPRRGRAAKWSKVKNFTLDVAKFCKDSKIKMDKITGEATQNLLEDMQNGVPMDTGFLKSSLSIRRGGQFMMPFAPQHTRSDIAKHALQYQNIFESWRSVIPRIKAGDTIRIEYGARYAVYVHDGTRQMAARPWMRHAMEKWGFHVSLAAQRHRWNRMR